MDLNAVLTLVALLSLALWASRQRPTQRPVVIRRDDTHTYYGKRFTHVCYCAECQRKRGQR